MSAEPALRKFTPHQLAIGVMVEPRNGAYRIAARQTWMIDAEKHATVKFVAGDVKCAHQALAAEEKEYDDIVFVKSDDCKKWHSPAKIHAWYTFALAAYPQALWIAKMEDDGLLWTDALLSAMASVRQRGSVYLGMMQWQGGCELSENRNALNGPEVQTCAGCWGGWFQGGAPAPKHCMPMWRVNWAGGVKEGTAECPKFHLAPFACGPFEARSRHLAHTVSRCDYANRYFDAMSRRGNVKQDWCVSADGGQGHAIGACSRTLYVADLGYHRQKYATRQQLNESHSVIIVHPIKSRGAELDERKLGWLVSTWKQTWAYLRRAPAVPKPIGEARVHFMANESRPRVERLPNDAAARLAARGVGLVRPRAANANPAPPGPRKPAAANTTKGLRRSRSDLLAEKPDERAAAQRARPIHSVGAGATHRLSRHAAAV